MLTGALTSSDIKLQEAALLPRFTVEWLDCSTPSPVNIRIEALRDLAAIQGFESGLWSLVEEVLRRSADSHIREHDGNRAKG